MVSKPSNAAYLNLGRRLFAPVVFVLIFSFAVSIAQVNKVAVLKDAAGSRLQVDGKDFMINGMNWDFVPIGKNYSYSLWTQPDDIIKAALDSEMPLLKNMGINAVRIYTGVPPRWVKYIYEEYGIYTMLNHSFGRYGVTLNGVYIANTDYADPQTREFLVAEVEKMVAEFRDVPGVLLYLLGNENNYGLFWGGAATEDIPVGETLETVRARHMYSMFNLGIEAIKKGDANRPAAMCNGDLLFIEIIAEEVKSLDILGTNMYRGMSFGDAFQKVKDLLDVPVMFTEFGSDAFNAITGKEDQISQAKYMLSNWKEIYEQSSGNGGVGNSIGGFTFQWSDGWWKYDQQTNLSVHDINAEWGNGGYQFDFEEGENNMNEEWFGVCAKGPTDERGLFQLYPRAAYYTLQKAHSINPYGPGIDRQAIENHFDAIEPITMALLARGDQAALVTQPLSAVRVKGVRLEMETYSTGGDRISTPNQRGTDQDIKPAFKGFDHMQSYYAEFEASPSANVRGSLALNILGHIAENPIDEIFYENRGRLRKVQTDNGSLQLSDIERLKVYRASVTWEDRWFKLDGFFRTGHYHWAYEGDFFGLYPEANYGPNIDIYNGDAPLGFEMEGKRQLEGLKIAFGPELWWGANPAILLKYSRAVGPVEATAIYQEDLDEQGATVSSFAVPIPPTRKATIHLATEYGPFGFEVGGIWSGNNKIGDTFQLSDGSPGSYRVLEDQIKDTDTFGGKAKITFSQGRWNWYAQGAVMGLVADGRVNSSLTFTGWRLKDSGSGNQYNFLSGLAITLGDFQVAPNFMWQKPIEGPIPSDIIAPGRPRNILADPFAVRGNRETVAGEFLVTYDPTPATWMYAWDSDVSEDAPLAVAAGFVLRHHNTTQDAAIGILGDGRTIFAFPGAPKARDLWEAHARIVSKMGPRLGLIANLYGGTGEPNGNDKRLIHRYGGDVRVAMGSLKVQTTAKINDWGPYDYHRDFNLTYPVQLALDVSTVVGNPSWFDLPQTRLGIRGAWRSLNKYSPRYCPSMTTDALGDLVCDPEAPGSKDGNEWEIRTYLHFSIGI